jgi:hypothetical protein
MSAVSSTKLRTPLPALLEERHFALDENGCANQGSLRNHFRPGTSVRPMHLFDPQLRIMITTSNSSFHQEEQDAQSVTRCSTEHHGLFRAVLRANRT